MSSRLLALQFAQLTSAWEKSEFNEYSDSHKRTYHGNLKELFEKIKREDLTSFAGSHVSERKSIIEFFFKSLEFLDSSTLTRIPFELVKCLESALSDWSDAGNKYIIVTSLVNRIHEFSFDPSLAINQQIYDLINKVYNLEFEYKLIQINLPRYLSRDYLANVVLYHELGHFVDRKYAISNSLKDEIIKILTGGSINSSDLSNILKFFPYLASRDVVISIRNGNPILQAHIWEYFCDLFASQYIGECGNHYLGYVTQMNPKFNQSHPSTINRVQIVNNLLSGATNNYTLELIKSATETITGKSLKLRYAAFSDKDIIELIPLEIEFDNQLHYLFTIGWDLWLKKKEEIKKINQINYDIPDQKIYNIINNLIEKSIGNYLVKTSWNRHHVST